MAVQIPRMGAGPVSASSVDGSCSSKQRYAYVVDSCAGFAELSPAHASSDEQLFAAIRNVPGALHVEWQFPKFGQGNGFASHCTQQRILVWSELSGRCMNMEFGIMRNQHTNDCAGFFTAAVMFKDPP